VTGLLNWAPKASIFEAEKCLKFYGKLRGRNFEAEKCLKFYEKLSFKEKFPLKTEFSVKQNIQAVK